MEALTVTHLGPLESAELHPAQLSVIIGPQASGKSLLIQLLYVLRDLEAHLARRQISTLPVEGETLGMLALRELLHDLRGVPFGYFARGTMVVEHRAHTTRKLKVFKTNRRVRPHGQLVGELERWLEAWSTDPARRSPFRGVRHQHFLPTERAAFTRLVNSDPAVLYAPYQPLPFRELASDLARALPQLPQRAPSGNFQRKMLDLQRRALGGEAYVPSRGPKLWKWRVAQDVVIPIEATSSGQSEAWPFFVIATVTGTSDTPQEYYLEEPETHLHPNAQVVIAEAIALLLRQGHSVSLTTHSPFLLMALNNQLQRHAVGLDGIDPTRTAAWRLGGGQATDVMDQDLGLLDLEELEAVAEQLGLEFDVLLEQEP